VDEQTGKFEDVYWADIHVNPGNSGGPAFSLETGAVLGMVLAYQDAPVFFDDQSPAFLPAYTPDQQVIRKYLESNSGIARIIPVEFIVRLLRDSKVKFVER
jgi:S1-C subfamily serine protease